MYKPNRLAHAVAGVLLALSAGLPLSATADWPPATGVAVVTGNPLLDPVRNRWYFEVRVRNTGADALSAPLRLVVDSSSLTVANAQGTTTDGKPYFDLPAAGPGLAPNAQTAFVRVELTRAGRTPPRLTLSVRLEDTPFPLQLLHVADIDSTAPVNALNNVKGFSALLDHFRADPMVGPYSLTVSSGDNWIPGPRYNAANDTRMDPVLGLRGFGRGDAAMLNAMGFVASTVGNHELDRGTAEFVSVIAPATSGGLTWPGAAFPYLSANLNFTTDSATAPRVVANGQPVGAIPGKLAGWATVAVGGQTIGLVGASTPTLRSITTPGNIGIAPADPNDLDALAAAIQPSVDALIASGVNKIVLLAHMQQIAVEQGLATRLRGVDIIVAGGSNTRLMDGDDVLHPGDTVQGPYPIELTGADGRPVLVVNTDGDYKYLGRLVADFDPRGVIDLDSLDQTVNGAWATTPERLDDLGLTQDDADPDLAAIADALRELILEKNGNLVGLTDVYLDGDRNTVRRQESSLGNLTADANLWLARQTDPSVQVSIKNGGGIRSPIGLILYPPGSTDPGAGQPVPPEGGRVSQLDIEGSLAFNNGLSLLTLTAAQLQQVIEHGVRASTASNTPGQFPQVGGLRFSWDRTLPAGARVRNLALVDDSGAVIDPIVEDGVLVGDPNRTLRIVTLDFLANGGDSYPFPSFPNTNRVNLTRAPGDPRTGAFDFAADGSEQDALAEYLGALFAEVPFDLPETAPIADLRVQTLTEPGKVDTVLQLPAGSVQFSRIGGLTLGGAEILTWDAASQRLFVVGPADADGSLRMIDLADPANPVLLDTLDPAADLLAASGFVAGNPTSVSVRDGLVAVAVPANPVTNTGRVAFYDTEGNFLGSQPAGALPDMLTWDHAGLRVLVANEGEPDDGIDPPGSVTVIDVPAAGTPAERVAGAAAQQLGFEAFNGLETDLRADGVRLFPGIAAANDLEPEYIAVAADDGQAWVALQEANTLARVDLTGPTYAIASTLQPLGTKDHSRLENALDASDRDGPSNGRVINIRPWPVRGMYMPDGIASYDAGLGRDFVLTANEGDTRSENQRIGNSAIVLDPVAFPDAATLKQNANLGRLDLSTIDGKNALGQYEALHVYGGRSFTIWDLSNGTLADSNDDIARVTAQVTPTLFNADEADPDEFDTRSDAKGAEPEAVTVGEIDGRAYAFVGLERAGGGFLIYDVRNPHLPRFVSYTPGAPDDIALEGMVFIPAAQSPTGEPLLVTANEVSNTLGVYARTTDD